jgi:hypothetical protein
LLAHLGGEVVIDLIGAFAVLPSNDAERGVAEYAEHYPGKRHATDARAGHVGRGDEQQQRDRNETTDDGDEKRIQPKVLAKECSEQFFADGGLLDEFEGDGSSGSDPAGQ